MFSLQQHGTWLVIVSSPHSPQHPIAHLYLFIELEEESPVINWSLELGTRLDSRLYALWNRTAGDCLLDSVLQATWGIYDKDSVLRKALHDSLHDCSHWWEAQPYTVPVVWYLTLENFHRLLSVHVAYSKMASCYLHKNKARADELKEINCKQDWTH